MGYNSSEIIMATRRSTYVVRDEQDFEDIRSHIYREMYDDYYDSNKIYFYGYWGSCSRFDWDQCYKIEIWSDCSDPIMAASIIKEHGGRYYEE